MAAVASAVSRFNICFCNQEEEFWLRKFTTVVAIAKSLREEETSLVSLEKSIGFTHCTKMLYKIQR